MKKIFQEDNLLKALITLLVAVALYRASNEFYEIAWGTGTWRGEFSRTWAVLYYSFIALSLSIFVFTIFLTWNHKLFTPVTERIIAIRETLGNFRWLLWLVILVAPIWFFQYTSWGFVFQKLYIRILIWIITVSLLSVIASRRDQLAGWNEFLASLIVTASAFSIAAALKYVNGYPFSFGWSEGNRLWDYSVLFGSDLYIYPKNLEITVFLDFGRRLIGGLPYIFPGVTIVTARLWVGLTLIIPYVLLGIAIFRKSAKNKISWLLLILWTFLFLKQGPIHAPLVLSAVAVALAWRAPLWYAIPLVVGAGYFVESSRFTWVFAPGIWIVMLEFSSTALTPLTDRKVVSTVWKRAILLGVLGIFGGFILPNLIGSAGSLLPSLAEDTSVAPMAVAQSPVTTTFIQNPVATAIPQIPIATATVQAPLDTATPTPMIPAENPKSTYLDFVIKQIKDQPLLWYRLLPNSTYDNGILLALLLAVMPLIIILIHLSTKNLWQLGRLQKLALILPLLAFLAVGLIASTKIGGGGDLHNMDMFLIGLLFTGTLAWQNGGSDWIQNSKVIPSLMKIVIVALLVNSSVGPLLEMRSFTLGEEASWLKTLTDAKSESTMEMLPTQAEVASAIQIIQAEADKAKTQGEVLFIDQRQLLTFGYITGIPLVPDYEKKLLMNQALSGNAAYLHEFYANLAAKRFSLIITEPLHTPIKDSTYQFGEENNAWVEWVSNPTLCYYEPIETLKTVRVQLLVPRQGTPDCASELP